MTADVSFYHIAILVQRVKRHSFQERNVLWNVLIVDHHDKNYYEYSLGQLERLYNATSEKIQNLNLFCFVRFKKIEKCTACY